LARAQAHLASRKVNSPFRLTENQGMLDLLIHLLPSKLKAKVSHQTVARDLKVLHRALDKKLETIIRVRKFIVSQPLAKFPSE
jgi:hypothetical protein